MCLLRPGYQLFNFLYLQPWYFHSLPHIYLFMMMVNTVFLYFSSLLDLQGKRHLAVDCTELLDSLHSPTLYYGYKHAPPLDLIHFLRYSVCCLFLSLQNLPQKEAQHPL